MSERFVRSKCVTDRLETQPTRRSSLPPMTVHILDPEVHMYDVPGHTLTEAATVIASMAEAGKAEWWPQFSYESDNGVVSVGRP